MAKRRPRPFSGGTAQAFCIVDADRQLLTYTTFAFEHDAVSYLKDRSERLNRSFEGIIIVPCVVSVRIN